LRPVYASGKRQSDREFGDDDDEDTLGGGWPRQRDCGYYGASR